MEEFQRFAVVMVVGVPVAVVTGLTLYWVLQTVYDYFTD